MIKKLDVILGQYSLNGEPWNNTTTQNGLNTTTLKYSIIGGTWTSIPTNNIKKIAGISLFNIKKCVQINYNQINKIQTLLF